MSTPAVVPTRVVEAVGSISEVCRALSTSDPVAALVEAGVAESEAVRLAESFTAAGQVRFPDGTSFGRVSGIAGRVIEERT
jgi:hypothetical protein